MKKYMRKYGPVELPFTGIASFCKYPIHTNLDTVEADVAVFGIPWDWGVSVRVGARFGPRYLRDYSIGTPTGAAKKGGYWDIQKKKRYLEGIRIVDCGDQDVLYLKVEETFEAITESIEKLLSAKAFPVILGGDHSITFPVVRAFYQYNPLHLIHIDAHLDYIDSIEGVRLSNSNPIKRVSELDFVGEIIQIGMRGIRALEHCYNDSVSRGNKIITMSDFRQMGVEGVISQIPDQGNIYVTIDCDALDPSIAPGVTAPDHDGMTYREMKALLVGIASRAKVVGFDLVELNPFFDSAGITQAAAVCIFKEFLGAIFDKK